MRVEEAPGEAAPKGFTSSARMHALAGRSVGLSTAWLMREGAESRGCNMQCQSMHVRVVSHLQFCQYVGEREGGHKLMGSE